MVNEASRIPRNVKNAQMIPMGDDSAMFARFDDVYPENEFRTAIEGRSIVDHLIEVTIENPGNHLWCHKARFTLDEGKIGNMWTRRFAQQWQAFLNQKEQIPEGMPIDAWAPLDKRRIMELKASRIYTVEQIAALTDMNGPNFGMDWRKLRDMAISTLKPLEGQATISRLTRENEDMKAKMEALERQISDIATRSQEIVDAPKVIKKRGRPAATSTAYEDIGDSEDPVVNNVA